MDQRSGTGGVCFILPLKMLPCCFNSYTRIPYLLLSALRVPDTFTKVKLISETLQGSGWGKGAAVEKWQEWEGQFPHPSRVSTSEVALPAWKNQ